MTAFPSDQVTALSPARTREIAARATSVDDRMRRLTRVSQPTDSQTQAALALRRVWSETFAPGDAAAFARRLSWDGLDSQTALRALAPFPTLEDDEPTPEWTGWLARMLAATAVARVGDADDPGVGPSSWASDDEPPFLEIWIPLLRAAQGALSERLRGADAASNVAASARHALDRQLVRELARFGERTLYADFVEFLREPPAGDEAAAPVAPGRADEYSRFVASMLQSGLALFLETHPALARQFATIADGWVEATARFLERLAADRSALGHQFNHGTDPGAVVWIGTGLSDPHRGRQRVMAIGFEGGLRLIYKPRDVTLDVAFGHWLRWAADAGLPVRHRHPAVLARDGYGWVEFVAPASFDDRDQVRRYYRAAGGMVCIAHALRARDLHMENIVAAADGPVLIDIELLLQPLTPSAVRFEQTKAASGLAGVVEDSCLATGLVSMIESGENGEVDDVGGLCGGGSGSRTVPRRVWRDLRSASLHFVEERTYVARVSNGVVLHGAWQSPGDYRADLVDGFAETYRFLLAHRDAIVAPDGPLAAFAGCWSRVVVRPTNQYAMLLEVLSAPRYQRDGVARSIAMDILARPFRRATSRPPDWALAREERADLERLDVPYFSVRCDDTTVFAGDRPIDDRRFVRSGRDASADRLRSFSEADLDIQIKLLRRAVQESVHTRFVSLLSTPAPPPVTDPGRFAALVGHAEWIGHELLAKADRADGGLFWSDGAASQAFDPRTQPIDLYDGAAGVALFLAALARVTGEESWRRSADDVMRLVGRCLERRLAEAAPSVDGIGAGNGLGSVLYGLTWTRRLMGEPPDVDQRRICVAAIARVVDDDQRLDVIGGSAGAILSLLAANEDPSSGEILAAAVRCGDRLLAAHAPARGGWAWPAAGGECLVGFAHGAAGIAYALLRLFDATGLERFRAAAVEGYRFVFGAFDAGAGNWPVALALDAGATPSTQMMTTWCHGAPGIALANAAALALAELDPETAHIGAALEAAARQSTAQVDHVCCGNMGRCEILSTLGRQLHLPGAVAAADRIADDVLARARAQRRFALSGAGFEYRVSDPGFFRGLSGIGYHLLRCAAPSMLPSVVRFASVTEP